MFKDTDHGSFFYRLMKYQLPNSKRKNLIYDQDPNNSCQFHTFIKEDLILAKYDNRFFLFNNHGNPLSEVKFE